MDDYALVLNAGSSSLKFCVYRRPRVEPWRLERGNKALDQMERELKARDWLACGRFTIADIALLAYTRMADEGGFDLRGRPAVRAWIRRCEAQLGLQAA